MFSYAGLYHGVLGIVSLAGTIISLIVLYRGHSVGKSPLGVSLTNLAVNQLGFALFGPATFIMPSYFAQHWVWGSAGCNMFGFLKSYFQIVIFSSVLILSIERYLNRWNIDKCYTPQFFYKLSIGLWLYDALWASFPLFGWGRYEKKDFSCDLVMTPMNYDGQWKDFSYTISFLFASFVLPSAIMFHLLGKTRNRKTMIVWKVNSKHTWLDSPQILKLTVIMIAFVFTLFCSINLFGFLDWLPVSLTGERKFYFETLHSILTHAMVLINPLWYLIGVSSVRQELGKNYVESAVRGSSRHFVVKSKSGKRKGPTPPKPAESGTRKTNKSESRLSRDDSKNRCALLQVKNDK